MSNLTDLVPPLELCKKIHAGEFADSALAWIDHRDVYPEENSNPSVVVRKIAWAATSKKGVYPAPTLQEIMTEIDNLGGWCPTAYRLNDQWTVDYQEDKEFWRNDVVEQTAPDNPATAALKLWLKLKGVEA